MSSKPVTWVVLPLGEVVQTQKGKKPNDLGSKNAVRHIPYINIAAFEGKPIQEYAPEQEIPKCNISDTLLVWDGARAGLAGNGVAGYIGSTLARVTSDVAEANYLFYFIDSQYGKLNTQTKGVGIPHLDPVIFNTLEFPLPPAAEQTRIVEKLEELLSDLDAGVAELKAAQKKLGQYRQSLLKAAVEGALTADWRKNQKTKPTESGTQLLKRILQERRTRWEAKQLAKFKEQGKTPVKGWQAKYPEPVAPDISSLSVLPEGWVWASIEQLGEVQLGRQRSPDKLKGINPALYIRAANITEHGIDFSDVLEMDFSAKERETFQLKSGDVLLTEASGSPQHVGRPVIWPSVEGLYCFQNTVIRFTPLGITSEYAFQLFLAWQKLGVFRRLSGGVGINHLSAGKFSVLALPLPSLIEQAALVSALTTAFESLALQEKTIEHSLKQATAQRKNILKAAFSGQLVPQNPQDEPASALLARVRAERVGREAAGVRGRAKKRSLHV